ncbi:MAG: hypothetical protein U9Q82_03090 [Chloroflexota bacterium]|nr:hypothetical protein [Chloroflexota bacterium]
MINESHHVVVGLGEIGQPLFDLLSQAYPVKGKDLESKLMNGNVEVLHICVPYEIGDFVKVTAEYIQAYDPELVIIHSTVVPGTTREIFEKTGAKLVYSPVRGKHSRMREDLLHYTKFVAGTYKEAQEQAVDHLKGAGFTTQVIGSPETLELAKLVSTTYFGLLIAWAQEVERFANELDVDYDDVMALTTEVDYFTPVIFQPGFIGGHCVVPNTYLLEQVRKSDFLDAIRESNEAKKTEWLSQGMDLQQRISPRRFEE